MSSTRRAHRIRRRASKTRPTTSPRRPRSSSEPLPRRTTNSGDRIMNFTHIRRFTAFALGALAVTAAATAAPAIIAHKSLDKEKIDAAAVKAVFLGKKVSWDGGGRVVLAVLKG